MKKKKCKRCIIGNLGRCIYCKTMTPSPNHQKQSGKAEEWRERFRKKFEIEYRQANFSAMVEDIESFIRQELSRQQEEIEKKIKKLPKYDFSKTGLSGEFYLYRDDVLAIIGGGK